MRFISISIGTLCSGQKNLNMNPLQRCADSRRLPKIPQIKRIYKYLLNPYSVRHICCFLL